MSLTESTSLERAYKRLDKAKISSTNKDYIRQHDLNLSAKGIKQARRKRYVDILIWWAKVLGKDFKKVTKEDLIKTIDDFNSDRLLKKDGKTFAYSTKQLHLALLKTFYKHLEGQDKVFPEKVEWIKPDITSTSTKLPEDIFTQEEIESMINAATSARNAAIIAVLAESGARASEFLKCRLKDLKREKESGTMRLMLDGKTNQQNKQNNKRSVLLVSSVPYLSTYLQNHPDSKNPDAPLWFTEWGGNFKGLSYPSLKIIIKNIGKRAGITNKRLHAHNFRHTRETELAKVLTPSQLAVHFGHAQGSKMITKYVHLSGRDNDNALLRYYGLAENEDQVSKLAPAYCRMCKTPNVNKADYCSNCGHALSQKAKIDAAKKEEEMMRDRVLKVLQEQPDLLKKIE